MKVKNMTSNSGNKIANQFIISDDNGRHFQSYDSMIAFIPHDMSLQVEGFPHQRICLDKKYWDYSTTTSKYRNIFLGEKKADTERKIKSGVYLLVDLNN